MLLKLAVYGNEHIELPCDVKFGTGVAVPEGEGPTPTACHAAFV